MKTLFLFILISSPLFAGSSKKPIPQHLENTKFDAEKVPIPDEPVLDGQHAMAKWKEIKAAKLPSCEKHSVWKLVGRPNVAATAFKNQTAPVKGQFGKVHILLVGDTKGEFGKGIGHIDMTSWSSGNVPRDRRVQRYIFRAEEKDKAVAPFSFTLGEWKKSGGWETTAKVSLKMIGHDYEFEIPVKVKRTASKVKIESTKAARLTYADNEALSYIEKIMDRCNHQFLGTFADVELKLSFKNLCRK